MTAVFQLFENCNSKILIFPFFHFLELDVLGNRKRNKKGKTFCINNFNIAIQNIPKLQFDYVQIFTTVIIQLNLFFEIFKSGNNQDQQKIHTWENRTAVETCR